MTTSTQPPKSFWVIAVLALIWNIMGVLTYLGQAFMTEEALNILPEAERALYNDIPAWATAAFAIAVFGGAIGCILLLLKKAMATNVFILSLLGVIVQMIYNLFISNAMDVYGPGSVIMPIMIIIISLFLVRYSKTSTKKGWIS